MTILRQWLCVVVLLLLAAPVSAQQLNRRTVKKLKLEVIPAYRLGQSEALLKSLAQITARMKPEQFQQLDDFLLGQGLPKTSDTMVQARMVWVLQGQVHALPKPHLREILLMVPSLVEDLEETLDTVEQSVAFADPIPKFSKLEEYEALFWEFHILSNRLDTATALAKYGAQLVDRARQMRSRTLEEERQTLDADFRNAQQQLIHLKAELRERRLEARLDRMQRTRTLLLRGGPFMERLQGVFAAQLDSRAWTEALENRSDEEEFQRERLDSPELEDEVIELKQQLATLCDDDLTRKSELFYQGLHWWLRGRFGRGPNGGGMLKSMAAVENDQAQFGLIMPVALNAPEVKVEKQKAPGDTADDQPTDKSEPTYFTKATRSAELQPDYPFRHHYNWNYEYRQKRSQSKSNFETVKTSPSTPTKTTKLSHFY